MARYANVDTGTPAQLDLQVYRGDSFSMFVRLSAHGLPVHTDGFMFNSDIRTGPDAPVIATFSIDTDVAYGSIRLFLTSQVTQILPPVAFWDLQYRRPIGDDRVFTVLRGQISTFPDITYIGG